MPDEKKIKKIPNFKKIYIVEVKKEADGRVILPRFTNDSNDEITIKYEHFIKKENENAGKGSYGTGYISLGVEQIDENGNTLRDINGNPILKKETRQGGFQRFIKEYDSAKEKFEKQFGPKEQLEKNNPNTDYDQIYQQVEQNYEQELCLQAENTYYHGQLGTKAFVKDKDTGKYYLVMHAIVGKELAKHSKQTVINPHDKIIISKNIALETKSIGDRGVIHNDLKPANFMLDELSIRAIDFDESKKIDANGQAESTIGTLAYDADEKLNPKNNRKIVTKKTDVYAAVASIANTIIGPPVISPFDNAYQEALRSPPLLKRVMSAHPIEVRRLAMKRYFGKNIPKMPNWGTLNNKSFGNIEMCPASYDRMVALKQEINKPDYLLSQKSKNKLIDLCARGMAINPDIRPTQEELAESLQKIAAEFHINYLNQNVLNFIEARIANLKKEFPIVSESEDLKTLAEVIKKFAEKEKVSENDIQSFNKYAENTLINIENEAKFTVYLNNIDKKIDNLANHTKKYSVSPDAQKNIKQLKNNVSEFRAYPTPEKIKNFSQFQDKNVSLLNHFDKKIAGRYGFFKKHQKQVNDQVNDVYEAMKKQPNIILDDYSKTITLKK